MTAIGVSTEAKRVVRSLWDQGFNAGNLEVLRDYVSPTCVDHDSISRWVGPESAWQWFAPLRTLFPDIVEAFPDMHATFDGLVGEGDRAVVRGSERGIFLHPFRGAPPSGKLVRVTVINVFKVEDGRIVERWGAFSASTFLKAVGLIRP